MAVEGRGGIRLGSANGCDLKPTSRGGGVHGRGSQTGVQRAVAPGVVGPACDPCVVRSKGTKGRLMTTPTDERQSNGLVSRRASGARLLTHPVALSVEQRDLLPLVERQVPARQRFRIEWAHPASTTSYPKCVEYAAAHGPSTIWSATRRPQ